MVLHRLVILYGVGGLSDCGRHAVQLAVEKMKIQQGGGGEKEKDKIESITVLTPNPELLDEPNWNCGCPHAHQFSSEEKNLFKLVPINDWKTERNTIKSYFQNATAVISCLGNRQPTFMNVKPDSWCSHEGNQVVIEAMKENSIKRAVVLSSMGINEDWPPGEFHWGGKAMSVIFTLFARKAYKDLSEMENAYRRAGDDADVDLDYLLVRPVGIPEDKLPENQWHIQKEKHKDTDLSMDIAKLDVARYMMEEALNPTRHKDAVVIGGVLKEKGEEEGDTALATAKN